MKIKTCFFGVFVLCILAAPATAFWTDGEITDQIGYDNLTVHPSKVDCSRVVSKNDRNDTDCLPKITGTLKYTIDKDKRFKAHILFVTLFDEVMAYAEVDEMVWERNTEIIFEAFIHINPQYTYEDIADAYRLEWKIIEE